MEQFTVTGLFYENNGHKCRKFLDIKRCEVKVPEPDLMVVMMNPGSSRPIDENDDNTVATAAVPDTTQNQIMKVMERLSFNYARILNLSDLRTPDSSELYRFLRSETSSSFPHSIFDPARVDELNTLFKTDVPVVYGWGVNSALTTLSKMAVEAINHHSPAGIKKSGSEAAYYHPLPRVYSEQVKWVDQIVAQLKRT